MTQRMFEGVPQVLARDGWWLGSEPIRPGNSGPAGTEALGRAGRLMLLVLLADILFWGVGVGVSLAIYALAVFAVATWDVAWPRKWRPLILLIIAVLPVIELVQSLSVLFLGLGLATALVWARVADDAPWLRSGLAWLSRLPLAWVAPLNIEHWAVLLERRPVSGEAGRRLARDWAFPIGGTIVFAALMIEANPVLEQAMRWEADWLSLTQRGLFWGGTALLLSPLLDRSMPEPLSLRPLPRVAARIGINRGSVLRALITFNALIGIQTVMDATILLGGAALPEGMSYAEYAHRGAYPLLATALLAGAFALAARPFLGEHRLIKPLLLLWLGQNVILCGAAILRTELYIDAYGLTYLRLHALIWMALVAVLLALAIWQVFRHRSNGWLLWRGAAIVGAVLYACCFVNFAVIIATDQLRADRQTDLAYLCDLGPLAYGAVQEMTAPPLWPANCGLTEPEIANWQEWGFRKARVARYVSIIEESTP